MGSTIIRASHVGAVYHQVSAYYGTPTSEDIEIAKRAAILTKQRWAEERGEQEKRPGSTKSFPLRGTERTSAAGTTRKKKSTPQKQLREKYKPTAKSKLEKPCLSVSPTPAQKLGITDAEFIRRMNAIRKHCLSSDPLS